MQGVTFLPGILSRVDHIGGANGTLMQLVNNGSTCNSNRMYSMSQPEFSGLDQYVAYNKDLVRQTMLKQEALFRAQVLELHRLYTRQRELMDEIRGKEQCVDHIRKQSSQPCSKMLLDVSRNPVQMPRWLLVNPKESMTSALVPGNLEKFLTSLSERSSYRDSSSICFEKNYLRVEDRASSSKRRNCGKTILDLELPAEAYIDDDDDEHVLMEQNPLETPRISSDPCNRTTGKLNLGQNLSKESSCNVNSSCLKINYLLDLNESPQLGEPETAKCNGCVESHSSITGLLQKDLPTGTNENGNCEIVTEHSSNKRCIKEPNAVKSSNGMDLNVMPSSCLIETAISGEYMFKTQPDNSIEVVECPNFPLTSVSSSVHIKSFENEEVHLSTKHGVTCSSHSSNQTEMNTKKDSNSNTAKTKISLSPDDKEHSLLSKTPEDNVIEILFLLSEQKTENADMDFEKIAAENIISLSKSSPRNFLKASRTMEKTPSDCLDWFADVICSIAESRPEKLSRKYMTLKCNKAMVDDQLSAIKRRKNKRTRGSSSMLVKQEKSRRSKKQKQIKEFQSDALSSCDRKSRVKKSQRTKKIGLGPVDYIDVNEVGCLLSDTFQWGKKNRRQNGRRARADNLSW